MQAARTSLFEEYNEMIRSAGDVVQTCQSEINHFHGGVGNVAYLNKYCGVEKTFHVHNLNDVDATLLEPASCAAHGLEKIAPKVASTDMR